MNSQESIALVFGHSQVILRHHLRNQLLASCQREQIFLPQQSWPWSNQVPQRRHDPQPCHQMWWLQTLCGRVSKGQGQKGTNWNPSLNTRTAIWAIRRWLNSFCAHCSSAFLVYCGKCVQVRNQSVIRIKQLKNHASVSSKEQGTFFVKGKLGNRFVTV